jgi:hypothetical protein
MEGARGYFIIFAYKSVVENYKHKLRLLYLVVERSSNFLEASLLIGQFYRFSNFHAHRYQSRCSSINSKAVPETIHPLLYLSRE